MKIKIEIEISHDIDVLTEKDYACVDVSIEALPLAQRHKLGILSDLIFDMYEKQLALRHNVKRVDGKLVDL